MSKINPLLVKAATAFASKVPVVVGCPVGAKGLDGRITRKEAIEMQEDPNAIDIKNLPFSYIGDKPVMYEDDVRFIEVMKVKGDLKIRSSLAQKIKTGVKKYEFRKVIKGLVSGWYRLLDLETGELLFYIYIQPLIINPKIKKDFYDEIYYFHSKLMKEEGSLPKMTFPMDKESYEFVRERYENKHDFIAYEILDWKEPDHA